MDMSESTTQQQEPQSELAKIALSAGASADNVLLQTHLLTTLKAEGAVNELGVITLPKAAAVDVSATNEVKAAAMPPPPPPPPPTPMSRKLAEKALVTTTKSQLEMSGDHGDVEKIPRQSPIHSPKLKTSTLKANAENCIQKMAVQLKSALEVLVLKPPQNQLQTTKATTIMVEKIKPEVEEALDSSSEQLELLEAMDTVGELQTSQNKLKMTDLEQTTKIQQQQQAMELCDKEELNDPHQLDSQSQTGSSGAATATATATAAAATDDELLSLQVLSARSSTPYLQPMCCSAVVSCDQVSPVKDVDLCTSHTSLKAATTAEQTEEKILAYNDNDHNNHVDNKRVVGSKILQYKRDFLLEIRDTIWNSMFYECDNNDNANVGAQQLSAYLPHIVNCEVVELEARLRHLNILKHAKTEPTNNNNNNNNNMNQLDDNKRHHDVNSIKSSSSQWNDMMPAFYKRKNENTHYKTAPTTQNNKNKVSYHIFFSYSFDLQ